MENKNKIGRYLCLILRHKPETIGIRLDEHGWADVDKLLEGVSKKYPLTKEELEEIVRTDEKQRYSFSDDHTRIRANQGHSVPVDVELEQCEPPELLYHGTRRSVIPSIDEQGLKHGSRLYVHMTADYSKALQSGARRRTAPVVYVVMSGEMYRDGYVFYRSVNNVWLTETVPPKYLRHD